MTEDELDLTTPTPFYIHASFLRLNCQGDCDWCEFTPDEEDNDCGVCPDDLWYYVLQRQKVMQKFDASHPPVCPNCNKQMVADRTITLVDKDVTAFSCNHCHKFERDSRYVIERERFINAKS